MSRTKHARRESDAAALKANLASALRERDAWKKAYGDLWNEHEALKLTFHEGDHDWW
jgi:hypothetical protein